MIGVTMSAKMVPTGMPLLFTAMPRERSCMGNQREYKVYTDGKVTASPRPMAIRAAINAVNPPMAATGVSTVNRDHHNTPVNNTTLPPKRSARRPPTTCVSR